ncbi:hypothetical protein YM304_40770 [Ilumatobacter coccineus YM16-304]|uniref:Uncharacterized protein n=1 Tax=Ilumatobacter coccineus (strain NBRC 103263 / KCTC 29153 / YM16-304) TaxID=1313172 RepID=A0A6C7ED58_ILUCY|nr:hypothetical protein YM304_40770 [Ilumatobacter coccineus YM16-304]
MRRHVVRDEHTRHHRATGAQRACQTSGHLCLGHGDESGNLLVTHSNLLMVLACGQCEQCYAESVTKSPEESRVMISVSNSSNPDASVGSGFDRDGDHGWFEAGSSFVCSIAMAQSSQGLNYHTRMS